MSKSTFSPGFRISAFDTAILCGALVGSVLLYRQIWWAGCAVAFVVLHFFLFCNVFRIARIPELIWATTFITLAASTILTEGPGWLATAIVSLSLSAVLIARETRKPDYHGICWQTWNPSLPEWWKTNRRSP